MCYVNKLNDFILLKAFLYTAQTFLYAYVNWTPDCTCIIKTGSDQLSADMGNCDSGRRVMDWSSERAEDKGAMWLPAAAVHCCLLR